MSGAPAPLIATYDALDRLTGDSGATFGYDANGNRNAASGWSYTGQDPVVAANSNRFTNLYWDEGFGNTVTYDGAGNLKCTYGLGSCATYNAGNRAANLSYGPQLRLQYNGLGEPSRTDLDLGYGGWLYSYYYYGPDGLPLGMREQQSSPVEREWVYLEGLPVAQFENRYTTGGTFLMSQVTYLHPDHLGTPRSGTDSTSTTVWRWAGDGFGLGEPTGSRTVPLRFPGQIYSGNSTWHLNYFRTYDARVGRYLESDPIGIAGGTNTYGYVAQNPLATSDPLGLFDYPQHLLITQIALKNLGADGRALARLPRQVAGVDFQEDSQEIYNSHMHAMCPAGLSKRVCAINYQNYIDRELKSCDTAGLARALHAIQDSFAGGHEGLQTYGGLRGLTLHHLFRDYFLKPEQITGAISASQQALQQFQRKCDAGCSAN